MKNIIKITVLMFVSIYNAQTVPTYLEHRITAIDAHLGGLASVNLVIDDANNDKC